MPPSRGLFGAVSLVLLAVLLFMMYNAGAQGQKVTLDQFRTYWANGQIVEDSVVIKDDRVVSRLKKGPDGREQTIEVTFNAATREVVASRVYEITGGRADSRPTPTWVPFVWFFAVPLLLVFAVFWLISRGLRNVGSGGGCWGTSASPATG